MQTKVKLTHVLKSNILELNQSSKFIKKVMKFNQLPHFSNIPKFLFGEKTETANLVLTLKPKVLLKMVSDKVLSRCQGLAASTLLLRKLLVVNVTLAF